MIKKFKDWFFGPTPPYAWWLIPALVALIIALHFLDGRINAH